MRLILAGLLFVGLVFAKPDGYTTKYDSIDLHEILHNDRLYKKYFECLANIGPCTPDGKELKEIIPDALKTACEKCSEKHRKGIEMVVRYILENKRADYDKLQAIYDPEGIYLKKYQAEAEKRGIKI